jgi:L,D-peptidoglycan transpeptidase YkuD (ErfK/YbiS/YcfS/YnhG family)
MKRRKDRSKYVPQLVVRGRSDRDQRGVLTYGSLRLPCALGRSGRRTGKREGDGATPIGRFAVRQAFYRADRLGRPRTRVPLSPLRADDGWCDDPKDRNYNRYVRHPYPASAEHLWRTDGLYDLVVVIGHNDKPRVRGRGSAVFIHVAGAGLAPTAGCIALRRADLERLMTRLRPGTVVTVLGRDRRGDHKKTARTPKRRAEF